MNILKHMIENLFVTATGIAALIHSTWSLGTIFAGQQPDPTNNLLGFLGWIVPALLIAFALDIGQIFTSAEIRAGDKRLIKYFTFGIFALATYYLQWLYMAHHIPLLPLENGIHAEWLPQVTLMRDMAIWIVPAFMPLSTALYTISQRNEMGTGTAPDPFFDPAPKRVPSPQLPQPEEEEDKLLPEPKQDDLPLIEEAYEQETEPYYPDYNQSDYAHLFPMLHKSEQAVETYTETCDKCGWECDPKDSEDSAKRALRAHRAHCTAHLVEVE